MPKLQKAIYTLPLGILQHSYSKLILDHTACGLLETIRKIPILRSDTSATTHIQSFPSHEKHIGFIHQTFILIKSFKFPTSYYTLRIAHLLGCTSTKVEGIFCRPFAESLLYKFKIMIPCFSCF